MFLADPYAVQSQPQPTYGTDASPAATYSVPAVELPALPDRWWEKEEPPTQLRPILLNSFLPYVSVTGFFLNVPRFVNSFYETTANSRPSPALLNMIYLWGLKLASVDSFATYEPVFLSRAIQSVAGALGTTHPHKAKYALQAELLLSNYLFWTGRFLEGRYHCGAAVSIAISIGSHRTRSSQLSNPSATTDQVEEGERINAFWSVYLNDACWGVAMNVPSDMPDQKAQNARIDAPWPLDMPQYERGLLTSDIRGFNTVESFLNDPATATSAEEASHFAKICKGAALMEKAFRLVSSLKPEMKEEALATFNQELQKLSNATETFATTLPNIVPSGDINIHTLRNQIFAHTLVHMAFIHLNINFATSDISASARCVEAAVAMITLFDDIDLVRLEILPPIIASAWLTAGRVLIEEIIRLNAMAVGSSDILPAASRKEEMTSLLDRLELIMATIGTKAPIFSLQHGVLRKSRDEQLIISV